MDTKGLVRALGEEALLRYVSALSWYTRLYVGLTHSFCQWDLGYCTSLLTCHLPYSMPNPPPTSDFYCSLLGEESDPPAHYPKIATVATWLCVLCVNAHTHSHVHTCEDTQGLLPWGQDDHSTPRGCPEPPWLAALRLPLLLVGATGPGVPTLSSSLLLFKIPPRPVPPPLW
jgi:hypothetical protein